MEWIHKGIEFAIQTQAMGVLWMASSEPHWEGRSVRVRPFSALGRTEEEAVKLLKDQIELEYRKVPTPG